MVGERTVAAPPQPIPSKPDTSAKEAELAAALSTLKVHYAILGSRALVILAALGAFALFGWASYEPSGWRFAAACCFTVLVFGPALWIDRRG